jgi:hypothetical protein
MAERTLLEMPRLEERVRAACWMVPPKEIQWRRLETRTRERYDPKASWMVPLHRATPECYAVELVPCDADDPGAVSLHKLQTADQIRMNAQLLYEEWMENLPADMLS